MTPEPDPPAPVGDKVTFSVSNTLNNTYMVKFKFWTNGGEDTWPAGGTAVINQWNNLGEFTIPSGVEKIQVYQKAYNNQYTDWSDSYYDDAVRSKQIDPATVANKTLKVTVTGSNTCTYEVV